MTACFKVCLSYVLSYTFLSSPYTNVGMDEIGLTAYLIKCSALTKLVFPLENERTIVAKDVIESISFQGKDESEENYLTSSFFLQYINEISERKEGICAV